jgi:hypothetical protein
MLQDINGYDFGPGTANDALKHLEWNQDIEQAKTGKKQVLRRLPGLGY